MELKAQLACAFLLIVFLPACSNTSGRPDIRFKDVDPASAPSYSPDDTKPLRVAVAAVISQKGTVESYSDLLAFLGRRLNRRVELVQRQTYAEINDLIKNGDVDVAFVCTSAAVFVDLETERAVRIIPRPQSRMWASNDSRPPLGSLANLTRGPRVDTIQL